MNRARSRRRILSLCVGCLAGLSACSVGRFGVPRASAPLATSLQELVPHGDRDHFVFLVERSADGQRRAEGLQVEHVTALQPPGEFEVALSENGIGTGLAHIRDDGRRIMLVSEDDLTRGVRLSYDPPLTYLEAPLLAGERHAESTATLTRLSDGRAMGSVAVTQVIQIAAAPAGRSPLVTYERGVLLRTVRSLQFAEGTVELNSTLLLVPGIGEISSEGSASGAPAVHRTLACATIGGRQVGDCRNLSKP